MVIIATGTSVMAADTRTATVTIEATVPPPATSLAMNPLSSRGFSRGDLDYLFVGRQTLSRRLRGSSKVMISQPASTASAPNYQAEADQTLSLPHPRWQRDLFDATADASAPSFALLLIGLAVGTSPFGQRGIEGDFDLSAESRE